MSEAGHPVSALRPGQVLAGRYRLQEIIARGGMAEVWDAVDALLARPVAVKVPLARLEGQVVFRQRFQREAIAAASLTHPNVVAIYDTGIDANHSFIVMERVRGKSLREVQAEVGPLPVERAVVVAAQVATALDFAHRTGVIHRDVKPANILLTEDDSVKVTDFGIAKAARDEDLTLSGVTMGTARYLAPEQVEGKPVDRRCDIYSLGVVIYEMLCGRTPFDADTDLALAIQHVWAEPPAPTALAPGIPPGLEAVVLRALAKSPDDRFPTAADLAVALRREGLGSGGLGSGGLGSGGLGSADMAPPELRTAERPATDPVAAGYPGPGPAATSLPAPPTGVVATRERPSRLVGSHGSSQAGTNARATVTLNRPGEDPRGHAVSQGGPHASQGKARRLVPAVAAVVVVVAVITAAVLVLQARRPASPAPTPSTSAPAAPAIRIAGATAFDPMGDGVEDNADLPNLYDGNPATSWHTDQYASQDFGHLKSGVGFVLDLSASRRLDHLALVTSTPGWDLEVYVSGAPHSGLAAWGSPVASATDVGSTISLDLRGRTGAAVLVWITRLGSDRQVSVGEAQLTG